MRECNGDFEVAAKALGMRRDALESRVAGDPQLRALWAMSTPDVLDTADANRRGRKAGKLDSPILQQLAEDVRRENVAIVSHGLLGAGVSAATLKKLGNMNTSLSGAAFLVASLDLSHKMSTVMLAQLFEEATYIQEHYLRDDEMPSDIKVMWQRAYNEIVELLGKGYDRNLNGTQVLAKIYAENKAKDDDPVKNAKPAFAPLTRK